LAQLGEQVRGFRRSFLAGRGVVVFVSGENNHRNAALSLTPQNMKWRRDARWHVHPLGHLFDAGHGE
jgi:hypothetical protein